METLHAFTYTSRRFLHGNHVWRVVEITFCHTETDTKTQCKTQKETALKCNLVAHRKTPHPHKEKKRKTLLFKQERGKV